MLKIKPKLESNSQSKVTNKSQVCFLQAKDNH